MIRYESKTSDTKPKTAKPGEETEGVTKAVGTPEMPPSFANEDNKKKRKTKTKPTTPAAGAQSEIALLIQDYLECGGKRQAVREGDQLTTIESGKEPKQAQAFWDERIEVLAPEARQAALSHLPEKLL